MNLLHITTLSILIVLVSCDTPCPEGCACTADIVTCSGLTKFPQPFQANGKQIEILVSQLPEIPANAFKDVPNAQGIHFMQVTIGTIRRCAFHSMSTSVDVLIELTTIGTIEGNAFHNIHSTGGKEFSISSSNITTIMPFAFDSIQGFSTFEIHSTSITTIDNYAFHRFNNIGNINMFDLGIHTMKSNAMEGFENIHVMDIYYSNFTNLECNTLNEIFIDLGRNFSFYSLSVACDCGISWLHDLNVDNSSGIRLDEIICNDPPQFRNRHLKNLTHADLCIWQAKPSCETPLPARAEACMTPGVNSTAGIISANQIPVIVSITSMLVLMF